jgi:hypothetical protein
MLTVITDEELMKMVDRNPKSIIARAYRLGRKKMNQELIKAIETESTQPHVMMV